MILIHGIFFFIGPKRLDSKDRKNRLLGFTIAKLVVYEISNRTGLRSRLTFSESEAGQLISYLRAME